MRRRTVANLKWWVPAALLLGLTAACRVENGSSNIAPEGASAVRRVAIVSYDAGETFGLLPVSRRLVQSGVEVDWLPLTPWSRDLLKRESIPYWPLPEKVEELPHLENRRLASSVEPWAERLRELDPALVLVGMVSEAQRQIAEAERAAGRPTVGFYDAFDPPSQDSISLTVARDVDEIWTPSVGVRDALDARGLQNVWLAGQPSVENWYRLAEELEPARIRAAQELEDGVRYVLFAGQYGAGYEAVFRSFIDRFRSSLDDNSELILVVSHHPRTDGSLERAILDELEESRFVMAAPGLSTAELATTASVVATWRSTVGIQAAFIGKPVIYYSLATGGGYRNGLIESGAAMVASPETLRKVIGQALEDTGTRSVLRQRLEELGYVIDSDGRIATRVLEMLAR